MNKTISSLFLAAFLAVTPAMAQDGGGGGAVVNPITLGKGPKEGTQVPAWIFYWLLGASSVITGGLLLGLRTLWSTLQDERKSKDAPGLTPEEHARLKGIDEIVAARNADDVPRIYTPRSLPEAIASLTTMAQEALVKLDKQGDAREDRATLHAAHDTEKSQMRILYTDEIKSLQAKLGQEQQERREDTQNLWQKNDATTREVMAVIRDMIIALENSSKVIETYHEAEEEAGD